MAAEPTRQHLEAELAEFRRLTAEDPDGLFPRLAYVLSELSSRYRDDGRTQDALELAREAADLFAELAECDDRFREGRAMALTNLGARLQDAERLNEAAEISRQAAEAAAGLDGDDGLILASARINLASQLLSLDRAAEAEDVLRHLGRDVRVRLEAGERDTAAFIHTVMAERAKDAEANGDHVRHLAWRRGMVECLPADPAPGRAVLALALDRAAADGGDRAAAWAEEAVSLLRRLAGEDPARYGPALAKAAMRWLRVAQGAEAIERAASVAAECTPVASEDRAAALTMLAMSLTDRKNPDAVPATDEAVAAWRVVPGAGRRLATVLNLRAAALAEAGDTDDAIGHAAEAAAIWRSLSSLDPESDGILFADTLRRCAQLLASAGRRREALAVAEEGMALCLSSVVGAGVADPKALADFERIRAECRAALG